MTVLLAAFLITLGPKHGQSASFLGQWTIWRITSGSYAENPPKREGELLLKANGTFFLHAKCQDIKGAYRVHSAKLMLDGISISTNLAGKKLRQPARFPLVVRDGLLWDGEYDMGFASFVYARPGKRLILPLEKDWPHGTIFWRE